MCIENDYVNNRRNFFENDRLYITGCMNENITNEIIPKFPEIISNLLNKKDPTFEIIINSQGGYDYELIGILYYLNIMKKNGIKIVTKVIGQAASNASLLACYGDERIISKYGFHMIHFGAANRTVTTILQSERFNESNKRKLNRTIEIYEKNTKLTRKQLEEMLKDDNLEIDAETCIKYGLADIIE